MLRLPPEPQRLRVGSDSRFPWKARAIGNGDIEWSAARASKMHFFVGFYIFLKVTRAATGISCSKSEAMVGVDSHDSIIPTDLVLPPEAGARTPLCDGLICCTKYLK
jgi:hypothetical protein